MVVVGRCALIGVRRDYIGTRTRPVTFPTRGLRRPPPPPPRHSDRLRTPRACALAYVSRARARARGKIAQYSVPRVFFVRSSVRTYLTYNNNNCNINIVALVLHRTIGVHVLRACRRAPTKLTHGRVIIIIIIIISRRPPPPRIPRVCDVRLRRGRASTPSPSSQEKGNKNSRVVYCRVSKTRPVACCAACRVSYARRQRGVPRPAGVRAVVVRDIRLRGHAEPIVINDTNIGRILENNIHSIDNILSLG